MTTAAVPLGHSVALRIGFEVTREMSNVVYQVDLPAGMEWIDHAARPIPARSLSWRGTLKAPRTEIPLLVRGVKAGSWDVVATVYKGAQVHRATIRVPVVTGGHS